MIGAISTTPAHKFTGKERDAETGLDNFKVRFSAATMARFMSPDPSGIGGANRANPQTLNQYTYGINNPLRFVDPTGMTAEDATPQQLERADASAACKPTDSSCSGGEVAKENADNQKADKAQQQNSNQDQQSQQQDKDKQQTPMPTAAGSGKGGGQPPKGERRLTGKPEFQDKPGKLPKGVRENPDKPGEYQVRNPHTGNWENKSKGWSPYAQKASVWTTVGIVTYWIISEGTRVFPPRDLIPVP